MEIRQTETYSDWFDSLKDQRAKARIAFAFADCHWEIRVM